MACHHSGLDLHLTPLDSQNWYTDRVPDMETWMDIAIAIGVSLVMLLGFVMYALLYGFASAQKPVCPRGHRAISVDGEKSRYPTSESDIVTPDADYPTCSPMLSCPLEGQRWAVLPDGSSLTNTCEQVGCPCSAFRHCPAYVNVVFRQFGYEQRVSLFQVIDPLVGDKLKVPDPYDPPYLLKPATRDSCFLTTSTHAMLWPALALGEDCLRGKLAKLEGTPSLMLCAPNEYVEGDVFKVNRYMNDYRH